MAEITTLNAVKAIRSNDNSMATPAEVVEQAAREIKSGAHPATSVLLITLDETDGSYGVGYFASNLKTTDMLALLEVTKTVVLADMGFIPSAD